jgi:FMN reductase (NADPH)
MDSDNVSLRALEGHRSIRHYADTPIPPADLERMMRVAQRASSAGLGQLFSVIRVTDRDLRRKLADATRQAHVAEAAEFFVACLDVRRLRRLLEHRGLEPGTSPLVLYATTDALLALANMATAAEALGYGICYVGSLQRVLGDVIALLGLPAGVCPLLGLCLGVPAETPELSPRLPLEVVFHENQYRDLTPDELEGCYTAMAAATYGGGWFNSLQQHFTSGQEYDRREQLWRLALAKQGLVGVS